MTTSYHNIENIDGKRLGLEGKVRLFTTDGEKILEDYTIPTYMLFKLLEEWHEKTYGKPAASVLPFTRA